MTILATLVLFAVNDQEHMDHKHAPEEAAEKGSKASDGLTEIPDTIGKNTAQKDHCWGNQTGFHSNAPVISKLDSLVRGEGGKKCYFRSSSTNRRVRWKTG